MAATGHATAKQSEINPPVDSASHQDLLTMLNQKRANYGFKPLYPDADLDGLANLYLQTIIGRRSFMIEPLTFIGYPVLYQDIANAVGAEGYILRTHGLTLSFGIGTTQTFQTALDDDRNRPALMDNTMDLIGFASGIVGEGPEWLEEPPGGGVPVEITGYTIIVVITAGDF